MIEASRRFRTTSVLRVRVDHILITRFVVYNILCLIVMTTLFERSVKAQNTLKLSDGVVNEPYNFSFSDAVRGEGTNAQWTLVSGALPGGLRLTAAGSLEGTPTSFGIGTFEVKAQVGAVETFRTNVTLRILPASFDRNQLDSAGASSSSVLPAAMRTQPCSIPTSTFALASSAGDEETIALAEDADAYALAAIDPNRLEILNPRQLIQHTLQNNPGAPAVPTPLQRGDYIIVHLIRWKVVKADAEKTDPEKELWALYEMAAGGEVIEHRNRDDQDLFDTRIFASRRVAVLLMHLQTPRTWDVKYKINITRRIPEPIQNALQLARFIGGAGDRDECEPALTRNIWGGRLMLIKHVPSDVVVKLNTVTANVNGGQISQSKEYKNSYLNEGRYHWDVSVGMPVVSIKELEFSSENGIVTAKKKERQNAYGFLNLFPRAVDLKAKSYLTTPHFVVGVPISGKPLDRPVIGLGTGLYTDFLKINFFAGVAFNKVREPKTLAAGQPATTGQLESDFETKRVTKFVFGINFPVRQFIEAVKGKN